MTDPFVQKIKQRQAEFATSALTKPAERTEHEYGRVCGIYAGLEMALELYLDLLADRDQKDREL